MERARALPVEGLNVLCMRSPCGSEKRSGGGLAPKRGLWRATERKVMGGTIGSIMMMTGCMRVVYFCFFFFLGQMFAHRPAL